MASLRRYLRVSPAEFWLSIVMAMLGVMTVGVLHGVLIAVALTPTPAHCARLEARATPSSGEVDGQSGVYGQIGEARQHSDSRHFSCFGSRPRSCSSMPIISRSESRPC